MTLHVSPEALFRTNTPVTVWELNDSFFLLPLTRDGGPWPFEPNAVQLLTKAVHVGVLPAGAVLRPDARGDFEVEEQLSVIWRRPREGDALGSIPGWAVEVFTPAAKPRQADMTRLRGLLDLIHWREDLTPDELRQKAIDCAKEVGLMDDAAAAAYVDQFAAEFKAARAAQG